VRKDREAGGEAGSHRFAVDKEFLGDRLRKPFGRHDARSRLLAVDDQADLVAGQLRRDGAARGCLNSVRHLDQELVAGRVAEHFVDLLQLVEVDAKHGKPSPLPAQATRGFQLRSVFLDAFGSGKRLTMQLKN
jgi:hypothetical protein